MNLQVIKTKPAIRHKHWTQNIFIFTSYKKSPIEETQQFF